MQKINHNGTEFIYTPLDINKSETLSNLFTRYEAIKLKNYQICLEEGIDFSVLDEYEKLIIPVKTALEQRKKMVESKVKIDKNGYSIKLTDEEIAELPGLIKDAEDKIKKHIEEMPKDIKFLLDKRETFDANAVLKLTKNRNIIEPCIKECLEGDYEKIDWNDHIFLWKVLNGLFFD